ncbi:MAG: DsbA family protein [Erythrobacter sp.]|nr:DsbA family protein [Erythrobacter sp.]
MTKQARGRRLAARIGSAIAALALVGTGAVALAQNWAGTVVESNNGHRLGNPKAKTKLVEFMSYTCSHCADFAREGDAAIKLGYVPQGDVSYEIRHLLRDPFDLTAALLTHCGDPKKFTGNHNAIMLSQDAWFEKGRKTTRAQQARWQFGSNGARRQAIASDLGFYELMENRGYSRAELDRCLTDEAKANALAEASQADVEKYGLTGTPSFVMNGALLDGVHNWAALRPVLDKRR